MKPSVSLSAGPTDGVVWCSVLSLPNNLTGLNVPAHDTLLVLSLTSVATLQRDTMTRNTWNIWRSRRGSDLAEAAAKCDLSDLFCDYMNSERDEERFTDQVVFLNDPFGQMMVVMFPDWSKFDLDLMSIVPTVASVISFIFVSVDSCTSAWILSSYRESASLSNEQPSIKKVFLFHLWRRTDAKQLNMVLIMYLHGNVKGVFQHLLIKDLISDLWGSKVTFQKVWTQLGHQLIVRF